MQQDSTDPTGVRDDSPRGNKEVVRARHRKALASIELRKAGATWEEVAQVVGYPTGRAALVATEKALERELQTVEGKEFMRKLAGERLDRLLRSVWKKAIDEDHPEQFPAFDRARAVIADQRKLYGVDAPTEMVVHNPNLSEIERWVNEVLAQKAPEIEEGDIFDADWHEEGGDNVSLPAG